MSRTKWRLTKGDEQLDHAFASLGHHVSDDCLSAVAVCAYTARRLPLAVLAETVRASVVPEEYPATMARMYEWSPDEAVPEFYDDPSVFEFSRMSGTISARGGMIPEHHPLTIKFLPKVPGTFRCTYTFKVRAGMPAKLEVTATASLREEDWDVVHADKHIRLIQPGELS